MTAASFIAVSPCTHGILDVKPHLEMPEEDPGSGRATDSILKPLAPGLPRVLLQLSSNYLLRHYACQTAVGMKGVGETSQ